MKKIILASTSPRRLELIKLLGFPFEVFSQDVDESVQEKLLPEDMVQHLSFVKANAAAESLCNDSIIISADTLVAMEQVILGKPRDERDAFEALTILQNNWHRVCTGVTIRQKDTIKTFVCTTKVHMTAISSEEILSYIKTGEPMDKAGSYAIQGRGSIFIDKIDGDYFNVVGLPVSMLYQALKSFLKYEEN